VDGPWKRLLEPAAQVEGGWERETVRAYIIFSVSLALSTLLIGVFVLPPAQRADPYWSSSGFWIGVFACGGFSLGAHLARQGNLPASALVNVFCILAGAILGSIEFPWAVVMCSGALIVSGPLLSFRWSLVLSAITFVSPSLLLLFKGQLTLQNLIPTQVPNTAIPIAFVMSARLHNRIIEGHPQMAVLFMSGHTAEVSVSEGELLTKPFTRDELQAACARALASTVHSQPTGPRPLEVR